MSRVKISEFKTKQLILGDAYQGISLDGSSQKLPKQGTYVVKVDQGVKKRFLQGLVALRVPARQIAKVVSPWKKKGFTRFVAEPYVPHVQEEERYLSLERVREGIRILYSTKGGVEIEKNPESVLSQIVTRETSHELLATTLGLPRAFVARLLGSFDEHHFSFLELNPIVVQGDTVFLLDAAALVDSAASAFVKRSWSEDDVVLSGTRHRAELAVSALARTTSASLSLKVLNPDGNIFFLLSGGGGSIVIADEAALKGAGKLIGNYGEYSGGPTRAETHLYAREVLNVLRASKAKKKVLVIAGGVANFTDIKSTFAGVIDALEECKDVLRAQKVRVFVRRGGPQEKAGLAHMETYLGSAQLLGAVYGSDAPITAAVDDALVFIKK